jgi:hypothetical protein
MMSSAVDHPKHYTMFRHEVIELTSRLNFCDGNFVKYICRAPFKGREIEDLEKARWYLNWIQAHSDPVYNRKPPKGLKTLFADFETDLRRIGRDNLAEILRRFWRGWYSQCDLLLNVEIEFRKKGMRHEIV